MPTKNRKRITHSKTITRGGATYQLNNPEGSTGIYTTIVARTVEQLNICQAKWRRVLVVRYDLRQNHQAENSRLVTRWRKNLSDKLTRAYGLKELGFVWTREQEKAKHQHYHVALFLDGNVIRHPAKLNKIVSESWASLVVGNTVWIPQRGYYFMDNETTKADVIYRLSYLAKTRGKGYRTAQAKDFSASRLRMPLERPRHAQGH